MKLNQGVIFSWLELYKQVFTGLIGRRLIKEYNLALYSTYINDTEKSEYTKLDMKLNPLTSRHLGDGREIELTSEIVFRLFG